jgi:hypothetical protein
MTCRGESLGMAYAISLLINTINVCLEDTAKRIKGFYLGGSSQLNDKACVDLWIAEDDYGFKFQYCSQS